MATLTNIPLFPLHTVLFPDSTQLLRIFEPRYTKMLSRCLKQDTPFGICLIADGNETGPAASTYEMGTLVEIIDWNMAKDGILSVKVKGNKRFRILDESIQPDQLLCANIETIEIESSCDIPEQFCHLVDLYLKISEEKNNEKTEVENKLDASTLGFKLAELLPLKLSQKQFFLQLFDPIARLEGLNDLVNQLDPKAIA
jgi:Lon protease-like protein